MKILHMTLHKKWFNLIANGKKSEEYREIKPYWTKIFSRQKYDAIQFVNGYGNNRPRALVELKCIRAGLGVAEWGAPEQTEVYILILGKVLEVKNYNLLENK